MSQDLEWTIGRAEDNSIVLNQESISQVHARIVYDGRVWHIEDLGSRNGTFIDGVRIPPRSLLPVTSANTVTLAQGVKIPWPRVPTMPQSNVGENLLRIGRSPDSDIVLEQPIISWNHATLSFERDEWVLEDCGSRNGTAVGEVTNRIKRTKVRPSEVVYFGSFKITLASLLQLPRGAAGAEGKELVSFQGKELTIGRAPDCGQMLDFPMISWHHARILREAGGLFVEDLNSKNGTFVNGRRITSKTKVKSGDSVNLGSFRFQLQDSGELVRRDYFGKVTIEAADLTVSAGHKQLLAPVSFTVYPSELVALMGPAGAGKTTLLKALNGYTRPGSGHVLFNRASLYDYYELYRLQMGYVPQDDIVHANLQVDEALRYSLQLRTDLNEDEMDRRIDQVLGDLKLTDKKKTTIGSPEKKVLSGGQRKRVNIALELIHDTPVLFLDEPTSGLSSYDAEQVVDLLKNLTRKGKTIITTIHQPSLSIYKQFDNLIMVGRDRKDDAVGKVVFFGPAFPDSIRFFRDGGEPSIAVEDGDATALHPDSLLADLENASTAEWERCYQSSVYARQFVQERRGTQPEISLPVAKEQPRRPLDLRQWVALTMRTFRCKFRDRAQTVILTLQAPLFALLLTAMLRPLELASTHTPLGGDDLMKKLVIMHFLMVVASVWFGCNNAARDIVGEWSIFQRERMVSLKLPSYVFSKLAVLFVIGFVQNLIMLSILYVGVDRLRGNFLIEFGVLLLTNMIGAAIGLCLSARASTTESAIALLPVVLLPVIALGGGLQPTFRLPAPIQWVSAVIPSRWAFEANMVEEGKQWPRHLEIQPKPIDPRQPVPKIVEEGVPDCPQDLAAIQDAASGVIPMHYVVRNGDCPARPASTSDALVNHGQQLEDFRSTLTFCVEVLAAMFVLATACSLLFLRLRDLH
jgi:ABC-type multidrug transport system ATPase subunit